MEMLNERLNFGDNWFMVMGGIMFIPDNPNTRQGGVHSAYIWHEKIKQATELYMNKQYKDVIERFL